MRSIPANRPALGQPPGYVYLISSAARDQSAPDQPVCNGALELVCCLSVADQASISRVAWLAYRASRVKYQVNAQAYAASASPRSSLHPLSGLEWEPHSTFARGVGAGGARRTGIVRPATGGVQVEQRKPAADHHERAGRHDTDPDGGTTTHGRRSSGKRGAVGAIKSAGTDGVKGSRGIFARPRR